jgi:hypothetical protein
MADNYAKKRVVQSVGKPNYIGQGHVLVARNRDGPANVENYPLALCLKLDAVASYLISATMDSSSHSDSFLWMSFREN